MQKRKWLGAGLLTIGASLVFSPQISNITGFVVSSGITDSFGWIKAAGIGLMAGGLVLISQRENLEDLLGGDADGLKKEIKKLVKGKRGNPSEMRKRIYTEIDKVVHGKHESGRGAHAYTDTLTYLGLPANIKIVTRDADALNDALNFSRYGTYRHVYDLHSGDYLGIAHHPSTESKKLRWLYRLKKPVKVKK